MLSTAAAAIAVFDTSTTENSAPSGGSVRSLAQLLDRGREVVERRRRRLRGGRSTPRR